MGKGKKEGSFGVRVSYYNGNSETKWFVEEYEREEYYNLVHQAPQIGIKEIKRKKR